MRHVFSHRRSDPRWPGQDGRCEARRFHRDFGDGERGGTPVHNPLYDFNDDLLPIGAGYLAALVEQELG